MSDHFSTKLDTEIVRSVAQRVAQRCDLLADYSETPNSLTRTFCSDAMKKAHSQIKQWMEVASLSSRLDSFGNLTGCLPASSSGDSQEVFMIGSHLDTVVNAGRFDGALGFLLGLGVAEVIRESECALPFDLEVVGFSEEEGVRFGFPFIGSLGVTGRFDPGDFDRVDKKGNSIKQVLADFGCDPEGHAEASCHGRSKRLVGFMEAHLEQATLLEKAELPVGVVSGVAGQTRASILIEGKSGHAGTVPHGERLDALTGAARLILDVEELGQDTKGLFATIGSATTKPGLSNVISDRVELLLDLRHEQDEVRERSLRTIELMLRELGLTRRLVGRIVRADHSPAVPMDAGLTRHLTESVEQVQGSAETLVSGAGHDAMVMARYAPSCMLFVRCRDGISHHPDEFVSPEDIRVALEVMTRMLIRVAQSNPAAKTA